MVNFPKNILTAAFDQLSLDFLANFAQRKNAGIAAFLALLIFLMRAEIINPLSIIKDEK